jgi:hypothetical protein
VNYSRKTRLASRDHVKIGHESCPAVAVEGNSNVSGGTYLRVCCGERIECLGAIFVSAGRQFENVFNPSGKNEDMPPQLSLRLISLQVTYTLNVNSQTNTLEPGVNETNMAASVIITNLIRRSRLIAIYDRKKSVHLELNFLPSSAIDITAR